MIREIKTDLKRQEMDLSYIFSWYMVRAMADIDKVTIEELDIADSVGGSDKLIVGSSDGIAKSVTKSVLFNEEKSAREMNDAALLTRIQTMAGQTSDSSEEYPEYRVVEKMDAALKGASNGVAELDENGKVPMSQIPGGADDVRSAYGEVTFDEFGNVTDIQVYEDAEHTVPVTPESHIIYLDIGETQSKNFQYMWSGDGWARLGSSIVIGESASNAYRGDRGKIAYDHSQIRGTGTETAANPHGLSKADIGLGNVPNVTTDNQMPTVTEAATLETLSEGDTLKTIIGKVKKAVSSLISHITDKNNPHAVTKAQVGLGNVINVGTDGSVISGSQNNITSGAVFTALSELENRSQKKITGAATSITEDNLTVSKVLVSDESGKVAASTVTATELSQLSGVTSNVQEQLNNSIHYCTVLPSAPENRVYGTKETDSFSGAVKKLALTYFELSNGVYVPKKQVESTSLNIGSESSVNVTTISSDFTSINGSITVTDSTAVSGTVTVVRMYAGDSANRAYYPFGSGDGGNGGMTVECTDADCNYPLMFYDIGNGTGYVSCCCPISYNPSSGMLNVNVLGITGDYIGFGARHDSYCSSVGIIRDQIISVVSNGEQTVEECIVAYGTTETVCGCCCGICFKNRRLIDMFCIHSCVCMCGCDPESDTIYCVSNTVYQEPGCAGIWYCDNLTCKCQEIRLASAGIGYTASCHDFSGNILVRGCMHDLCGCAYAKVCDIGTSLKTECADAVKSNSLTDDAVYNIAMWRATSDGCYNSVGFSGGRSITYNPYTATLTSCNITTGNATVTCLCVDTILANNTNITIGCDGYTLFNASGDLDMSDENSITGVKILQTGRFQFCNCGTLPANWSGAALINVENEVYKMPGISVCDEHITMPDVSICMCDLNSCCGYFENQLTVGVGATAINDVGEASFSCSVQSKKYYAAADCVSTTSDRAVYFEGYNLVTGQAAACGAYIGCYGQSAEFGFRGASGTYCPGIRVTANGVVYMPVSDVYAGGNRLMLACNFNACLIDAGICCITRSGNTLVICQRS